MLPWSLRRRSAFSHVAFALAGLALGMLAAVSPAFAWQGPEGGAGAVSNAITYQGRLTQAGQPVSGAVDLNFTLFDALTGGNQVSSTILLVAVPVVDGVFTVELDFGPNAFAGEARWLEIGVANPSNNGNGPFSGLTPRQRLAATPFALFAKRTDLTLYSDAAVFSNPASSFNGAFTGAFAGPGSGLTNLNPAALTAGTANIDITGNAAFANIANSANSVTGIVAVTNGGTGGNDPSSARLNLQAAQRGANGDITSLSALSTPIAIFQGGTGSSDITTARNNLGAAKSGVNNDITGLSALTTPLTVAQGGTNANTAAGARSVLGVPGFGDLNTFTRAQEINLTSSTDVGLSIRAAPGQAVNLQQWRNSAGTVVSSVDASGVFTGNGGGLVNLNASNFASGNVPNARLAGTYSNQLLLTNPSNFISGISQGITNLDAGNLAAGTMPMARMPTGGTWNILNLTIQGSSSTTTIDSSIINLTGQVNFDETPTLAATTRTMAISPAAFTPATDTIAFSNAGTGLTGSTVGQVVTFIAPLNLPDDATITELRFFVLDNDATQNITAAQLARGLSATTPIVNGTAASAGNSATAQQIVVPPFSGPLDNDLTTLWLSATWTVPALPANMRLLGVRVTYTVTQPLP